jgi:catecholate siderophore receptor
MAYRSRFVLSSLIASLLASSSTAHAQLAMAESLAVSVLSSITVAATFQFEIAAGSLDVAIAQFRALTGHAVILPNGIALDGFTSRGATGTLTADEGLAKLLDGTGLIFRKTDARTYALEVYVPGENVEVVARAPYRADTTMAATKTLAPLRDVPQAVTVIPQQLIADQRMQSMADVVRYVPGVGMGQGEGNRDTPILRGNGTTADFFVDGVRDDVQYFRDLYNVERVEALKGPNAMIFGRGGAGGVIHRTTRQADWGTARELTLIGGSYDNRRATIDFDQRVNDTVAARLTSVYENSDSYRHGVGLQRGGVNPTLAFIVGQKTVMRAGYEYFHDQRTADRGVPSFAGRPLNTDASTFFGDPQLSHSRAVVHALTGSLERPFGRDAMLRNRIRFADYDKFYQNIYPSSAVTADGTSATISAYNNATARRNFFNQTDINFMVRTRAIKHRLLSGVEVGRQITGNFRETGYFSALGASVTAMTVPVTAPTISTPVSFRQSATDADNHIVANAAALYAQDEVQLAKWLQAVVGVRYDRFSVDARNNRTGVIFSSDDNLISPRVGVVIRPSEPVSLYSSYTVAYVPRAGDQLSSLSLSNQTLDPERFINYEVGVKWDVRPDVAVTTAVYRLDRTNVVVPDPNDVNRSLLVNAQRTTGLELGIAGNPVSAWNVAGGYAYQDGAITRTISPSARDGAALAHVPPHSFSLWNRYDFTSRVGAGLGIIHTSDMFAATDNTVTLPAFTRVDGALFVKLTSNLRAQANIENLGDARYYAFANGNNNITPGAPRTIRFSVTTRF